MANVFKIYHVNNKDKPGFFEFIFGKRKSEEIIKPLFLKDHDYKFLDSTQSILFNCKFIEKSKDDGLLYFSYTKLANSIILSDIKYVKADNGLFKIRNVTHVAVPKPQI